MTIEIDMNNHYFIISTQKNCLKFKENHRVHK